MSPELNTAEVVWDESDGKRTNTCSASLEIHFKWQPHEAHRENAKKNVAVLKNLKYKTCSELFHTVFCFVENTTRVHSQF